MHERNKRRPYNVEGASAAVYCERALWGELLCIEESLFGWPGLNFHHQKHLIWVIQNLPAVDKVLHWHWPTYFGGSVSPAPSFRCEVRPCFAIRTRTAMCVVSSCLMLIWLGRTSLQRVYLEKVKH